MKPFFSQPYKTWVIVKSSGYFSVLYMIYTILDPTDFHCMEGERRKKKKTLFKNDLLCSTEEAKSYRFGTT